MLIPKIFILAERLKPLVNVILTLCSCLLVRKHRITARLQGSVLDFWQTPALFYQMVRRLERMGELSKETIFIDGTKLEACANKYTFVWKKSLGK